jgi:hypothetical protein
MLQRIRWCGEEKQEGEARKGFKDRDNLKHCKDFKRYAMAPVSKA